MLYQITGNISYLSEYNQYKNADAAMKPYWPLGWDNVGPAVAYYDGNSSKIASLWEFQMAIVPMVAIDVSAIGVLPVITHLCSTQDYCMIR